MRNTPQKQRAVHQHQLHKCPTGIKGFDEITEGGPASRVRAMLDSLRTRLGASQATQDGKLKRLKKELDNLQHRSNQLYEAVEKGLLPMDSTLTERAHKLQAQRQALLTDMAGLRRLKQMPLERRRYTSSLWPCVSDCLRRIASSARST